MAEAALTFVESEAYESFMGQWSRAVGGPFLDWISAPSGLNWLDVGCGTGVFTELILEQCAPAAVFGIDPQRAQIEHARRQPIRKRALLRVADAEQMPYSDEAFDVVTSALTINFIKDRRQAVAEMRRVARPDATVAAFVWDFNAERSPSWPLRASMRDFGCNTVEIPGTSASSLGALASLFEDAGFRQVSTAVFEVSVSYADFDAFWRAQTGRYSPTTPIIDAMPTSQREQLIQCVRANVPACPSGEIKYTARANAVKALR